MLHCAAFLCGACGANVVYDLVSYAAQDGADRPLAQQMWPLGDAIVQQLALAMYAQAQSDRAVLSVAEALASAGPLFGVRALQSVLQLIQQLLGEDVQQDQFFSQTVAAMLQMCCTGCPQSHAALQQIRRLKLKATVYRCCQRPRPGHTC